MISWKYPLLFALGLMFFSFGPAALAQTEGEASDTLEWYWPTIGLRFQYPATWQPVGQEGFEFLLISDPAAGANTSFIGLQAGNLRGVSTFESEMAQLAADSGGAAQSISLGSKAAPAVEIILDNAESPYLHLIGFQPSEGQIALLIFSSPQAEKEAFMATIDDILASTEFEALALDEAALNEQVSANFAATQTIRVGDPAAPLTLVEVLDYSCPHCATYANSMKRLTQDYVQSGQIQFEMRFATFVGGPLSQTATMAQYCAASLGYGWTMHTALIDIHLKEGAQFFTAENINSVARDIEGLDGAAFETCLAEGTYADLLERDAALLAELGASATPTLFYQQADVTQAFVKNEDSSPRGGAIPLLQLYARLDDLLAPAE
jgi:protein-disulfide isomerase